MDLEMRRAESAYTDLQASQAVFCFRGGGRVFASSWIWFCMEGEEKLKARRGSDLAGGWRQGGRHAHWEAEPDASDWSG